jgi:hypothetical protein
MGTSITILSVVKEASAVIPLPWVQPAIGGVASLLRAVAVSSQNVFHFSNLIYRTDTSKLGQITRI